LQFPDWEKERVMEDRRGFWAVLFAPIVLSLWIVVPARADLLVHRLSGKGQAVGTACCVADDCAAVTEKNTDPSKETAEADASQLPLLVLTTVLFSNPDDTTPGGSSGGGTTTGTSGGGSNPPAHAPEPATVISALLGVGLAGMYTLFRRKRLVSQLN
jgi:hypothetical protein